jgi:hypothetical protein
MSDLWMIIGSLPVVLITSIFLGFEVSFYYGISLLGLSLWRLGKEENLKKIGIFICTIGTIFFFVTFVYYLTNGLIFPENPLEFKIPMMIYEKIFGI